MASNDQDAYEEGKADGRATRSTGRMVNTNKRPTERTSKGLGAYVRGHIDGQDEA